MRYHDLIGPPPDNTVLLLVRRGEIPKLEALIMKVVIGLHGSPTRMRDGSMLVTIACRDPGVASNLRSGW